MSHLRNSFLRPHPRPTILEIANLVLCPSTQKARPLSTTCLYHRSPSHPRRTLATSSRPPKSTYRGPASSETTQTDFSSLDVLGNTPAPSTSIDACLSDGFHLNSGVKVTGGDGVLLVGGEAFAWRPWKGDGGDKGLVNEKGQWEVGERAWGVLGRVWPRPANLKRHRSPDHRTGQGNASAGAEDESVYPWAGD
ncbi:DUF498 domain protein [Rutstroemia sp. NJR-2017a BBW]|nr:DUF498 domain protein [Rutstroemia sp. NJR-2017a BBW]